MANLDPQFMRRALALAERGRGRTSPNPMVGAVVVKSNEVVGEGFHQRAGTPHAEIHALRQAGERVQDATLYVSLEPCCHFGRTPPCTEAIIKTGIRQVVVAMVDPNPQVAGKGISALRRAGLETQVGLLEREAKKQNASFIKYISTGLPLVISKAATSLDGKIATSTGESKWITGPQSRTMVHQIRDAVDAVLVGVGTVLADDPLLTTRLPNSVGRDPVRIVVDSQGRTPPTAKIFNSDSPASVIIATTDQISASQRQVYRELGAQVLVVNSVANRVDLTQLIVQLGQREITSVLIEGGGEIHASAIRSGIVDHIMFFLAPILVGGVDAPSAIQGMGIQKLSQAVKLGEMEVKRVGTDLLIEASIEDYVYGNS